MSAEAVVWHDLECGSYREDLALWLALARAAGGPVLDVGAGTGRVTLELGRAGVDVVALDADEALVAALRERAAGLPVEGVVADARDFALGRRFALIIVPMQTLQLLGGPEGRAAFLTAARAHLRPGGLVGAALADALESYDAETDGLPAPDVAQVDGVRYVSLPLAVVDEGGQAAIHRLREVHGPRGQHREMSDVIRLDRVTADDVAAEARRLGFTALEHRRIPQTREYVGSTVVVLRA